MSSDEICPVTTNSCVVRKRTLSFRRRRRSISLQVAGECTHHRRTANTRTWPSGLRRPACRASTARCRWPTETDGNASGTARGTLCAPGVPSRCPLSGRSRPDAPSGRRSACRVCADFGKEKQRKNNVITTIVTITTLVRANWSVHWYTT